MKCAPSSFLDKVKDWGGRESPTLTNSSQYFEKFITKLKDLKKSKNFFMKDTNLTPSQ